MNWHNYVLSAKFYTDRYDGLYEYAWYWLVR